MRTIIYVRVSTDQQNNESQIGALKKRAHERGFEIIDTVEEKLSGAAEMSKRPGIKRLHDHISKGITNILVYDASRIGRDLFESVKFIRELTSLKVNIHITDISLNTMEGGVENPSTTLIINMMLSVAQYQRMQIREKVKLGVANYKKKNSRWGRKKGTTKKLESLKIEYKGVIRDLTRHPDWSLRLISRNRGVAVNTVGKLKRTFLQAA